MEPSTTSCTKCNGVISGVSILRCSGFCGGAFHLKCTTSTQHHLKSVQDVPNLFWYCDSCVAVMDTPQFRTAFIALSDAFRNLTEIHKTVVEDIKSEVAESSKKVDTLMSKLPAGAPTTPTWPKSKRRRSSSATSPEQPVIPKSFVGRKVMESTVPIIAVPEPDNLSWIWLSSFPPTVTEEDIRSLVRECLSCEAQETIDVKMLVKKDADIAKLRAVSFKVGVDPKYQEASMDGNNWPAGVSFREFIYYDRRPTFGDSTSGFSKNRRVD